MQTSHRILLILLMTASNYASSELILEDQGINFNLVTFIGHAGDDRLFIAEQSGLIKIIENGTVLPTPFLNISALSNNGFERGLLSFAFHPQYQSTGYIFVFYSNLANHSTIARYQVSKANPNLIDNSSAQVIYSVTEGTGHYGGQVAFGPDGYLYVSIGDGGTQGDPECDSQDFSNTLGTILRLDIDQNITTPPFYGIPNDNPYDGTVGSPDSEVWAHGFRNPWRFSFDRLTGELYISDVGQNTREEVNIETANFIGGNNYGWKAMEGTFCFDSNSPPNNCPISTPICNSKDLTPPAIEYDHNSGDCSITGGYVYRGNQVNQLIGGYLYGDWCSGRIWISKEESRIRQSELLNISLNQMTTFGEDNNGEIYISNGSNIYQIKNNDNIFINGFE